MLSQLVRNLREGGLAGQAKEDIAGMVRCDAGGWKDPQTILKCYQQPDEDARVKAHDETLHSPLLFLSELAEAPDAGDAFLASLRNVVSGSAREADEFRYGLGALKAWEEDLAAYDTHTPEERRLLFDVNWWCLMHLADARRAAVQFLDDHVDLLEGDARQAALAALEGYKEESELLNAFAEDHYRFIQWWGGDARAAQWDAPTRARQVDLLTSCRELEAKALAELAEAATPAG